MGLKTFHRLKSNHKKIIVLLALAGILGEGFYIWGFRHETLSSQDYAFDIFPGGYSPKESLENNNKTFSYWVEAEYPAQRVASYYDKTFRDKGWKPIEPTDWGPQRKWTFGLRPDPKTRQLTCSYSYQASWINITNNRVLQMTLVYFERSWNNPCPAGPRNSELSVLIQERAFHP